MNKEFQKGYYLKVGSIDKYIGILFQNMLTQYGGIFQNSFILYQFFVSIQKH